MPRGRGRCRGRWCTAYRAYFRAPKAELPINLSLCKLSLTAPPRTFISLTRSFPAVHCKVVKLTGSSASCPYPLSFSPIYHFPFTVLPFGFSLSFGIIFLLGHAMAQPLQAAAEAKAEAATAACCTLTLICCILLGWPLKISCIPQKQFSFRNFNSFKLFNCFFLLLSWRWRLCGLLNLNFIWSISSELDWSSYSF